MKTFVLGISRETKTVGYTYKRRFIFSNWLMRLWSEKSHDLLPVSRSPRSRPCGSLESTGPGSGEGDAVNPIPRAGKDEVRCPAPSGRQEKGGRIPPSSALWPSDLRVRRCRLRRGGRSASLTPPIPAAPRSGRNIHSDTRRSNV